jgi:glycerol-3-phosphate dehydrogenase
MIDDTSLEFDMFEDIRRKLVEVFVREGRSRLEAEKIALYVVQGVRDVPKLLTILTEKEVDAEILHALHNFLEDASALDKARELLLGLDHRDQG